jgi:hypothetical protein
MSWITVAGRRLWQAYCQGLEMSCPVQRVDQWLACARDETHDLAHNAARTVKDSERTLH